MYCRVLSLVLLYVFPNTASNTAPCTASFTVKFITVHCLSYFSMLTVQCSLILIFVLQCTWLSSSPGCLPLVFLDFLFLPSFFYNIFQLSFLFFPDRHTHSCLIVSYKCMCLSSICFWPTKHSLMLFSMNLLHFFYFLFFNSWDGSLSWLTASYFPAFPVSCPSIQYSRTYLFPTCSYFYI